MQGLLEHCTGCDQPVYWLKHERTGRWAPIDADLREDGNVVCDFTAGTYRIVRRDAEDLRLGVEPVAEYRVNHFAVCPQAGRFRPKARQSA